MEPIKPDFSKAWVRGEEYVCQEGSSMWQEWREERGWSRDDVWDLTGGMVTPGDQANFENEYGIGFPSLDHLIALAHIYGTSPGRLLDGCYESKGRELIAEEAAA